MITNNDIKQWVPLVHKIVERIRKNTFEYKTYIDWDEIEQAGLIGLYRALKGYNKSKGDFKNYAITAITRAIYRQLIFDRRIESHSDIDEFIDLANTEDVPTDNMDKPLIIKQLNEYIDKLPIKQRSKDILKLRLDGYTLSEIADKFNVSYQCVSDTIHNHVDKLRKYIGG